VLAARSLQRPPSAGRGLPAFNPLRRGNIYFRQTPKEVVMIFDADQQVRRIYLTCPIRSLKSSYTEKSVGHYEGDTLVVDTIGMNARPSSTATDAAQREDARDRTLEDDRQRQTGWKSMTIDDAETFVQPWQR